MSDVAELARLEAERAESEPEPEPEPGEPTPDEPPAPEPAVDDEDVEFTAKLQQLERENKRHVKAVAKLIGDDMAGFTECPTCSSGPLGLVALGTLGILTPPGADELLQAPDTETCEQCGGWGDNKTGAKVERGRVKPCSRCGGTGYTFKTDTSAQPLANGAPTPAALEPPWAAEARAAGYTIIAPYAATPPTAISTGGT